MFFVIQWCLGSSNGECTAKKVCVVLLNFSFSWYTPSFGSCTCKGARGGTGPTVLAWLLGDAVNTFIQLGGWLCRPCKELTLADLLVAARLADMLNRRSKVMHRLTHLTLLITPQMRQGHNVYFLSISEWIKLKTAPKGKEGQVFPSSFLHHTSEGAHLGLSQLNSFTLPTKCQVGFTLTAWQMGLYAKIWRYNTSV